MYVCMLATETYIHIFYDIFIILCSFLLVKRNLFLVFNIQLMFFLKHCARQIHSIDDFINNKKTRYETANIHNETAINKLNKNRKEKTHCQSNCALKN